MLTESEPDAGDPLKEARDAAFRKLGRNLSLFQQLESGLKAYYRISTVEGSSEEEVEAFLARRAADVAGETLGPVRHRVIAEMAANEAATPQGHISFRTAIHFDADFVAERSVAWDSLVAERNRLVHHLHQDFDLRTSAGIEALDARLDPQAERIRTELRVLQSIFTAIAEGRDAMKAAFDSGALDAALKQAELLASPLVQGLLGIARDSPSAGGWIGLQTALRRLRDREPDAEEAFRTLRGRTGLREALVACGQFEFREQPTAHGVRLLYRAVHAP